MQNEDKKGSLSETFDTFGAAPKADAWDAIAASLDEPKSRRRAVIWWWSSGLAAVLMVGFASLTFLGKTKEPTRHGKADLKGVHEQREQATKNTFSSADSIAKTHTTQTASGQNTLSKTPSHNTTTQRSGEKTFGQKNNPAIAPNKSLSPSEVLTDSASKNHPVEQDETTQTPVQENTINSVNTAQTPFSGKDSSEDTVGHIKFVRNYDPPKPLWRFGVYGQFDYSLSKTSPVKPYSPANAALPSFDTYSYPNYDSTPYMIESHGVLLTVGRSFLKSRKLWLESGLQYTSFKSESLVELGPAQKGWLKHEAIGIPLNVSYQLVRSMRWSVGVSAGILNQWVYKSTQKITANNSISIAVSEKPDNPKIYRERFHLLSGMAGLDFSYSMNPQWQFSVQPQFRYYFGSASDSQWPVTVRRGWMGGTIGLRYNL